MDDPNYVSPFDVISDYPCWVIEYGSDMENDFQRLVVGPEGYRKTGEHLFNTLSLCGHYKYVALLWRYQDHVTLPLPTAMGYGPDETVDGWFWEHSIVLCKGCD